MAAFAYWFACILLYLYMLFSSIEFGASLFVLFPKRFGVTNRLMRTYMNPLWEATSVFLVFFFITFFTCFPKALPELSAALLPIVEIALVFFGLRILGILGALYGESDHLLWRVLLAVGSFGAPVTLSGVYVYLLTGSSPTESSAPLWISIALIVINTILALSSTFFLSYRRNPTGRTSLIQCAEYSAAMIGASAAAYLLILAFDAPHMITADALVATCGAFASSVFFFLYLRLGHYLHAFGSIAVMIAFIFFGSAAAHLPYLSYPSFTIDAAATNPTIFAAIFIAWCIGIAVLSPALFLLYRLFLFPSRK